MLSYWTTRNATSQVKASKIKLQLSELKKRLHPSQLPAIPSIFTPDVRNSSRFDNLTAAMSRVSERASALIRHQSLQLQHFAVSGLSEKKWSQLVNTLAGSFVVLLSVMYLPLVEVCVSLFHCRMTGTSAAQGDSQYPYTLVSQPSQRCYDPEWYRYLPLYVSAIILYVIAFPLGSFYLLFFHRTRYANSLRLFHWFSPISSRYIPEYCYWECLVLARKAVVVLLLVFFFEWPSVAVGTCVMFIFLIFTVQRQFSPYAKTWYNRMEYGSLVATFVILSLQLAMGDVYSAAALRYQQFLDVVASTCIILSFSLLSAIVRLYFSSRPLAPYLMAACSQLSFSLPFSISLGPIDDSQVHSAAVGVAK